MADNPTPKLRFDAVCKSFGDVVAVDTISLDIAAGSFTVLVGASGSGKSTLLKMVNRLIEPTAGSIALDLAPISDHLPHILRRQMGYVFQGIGLFPHMNVEENILISKRLMGHEKDPSRAAELLDLVELGAEFAVRMPHELSGGQRQRVGVARALAAQPELLLMDEPFGALDPVTRDSLGNAVLALHRRLGLTTIMVTHDMAEALLLADRILVMEAGRIVADETPKSLLAGNGGAAAQALVAVPRGQAEALSELAR